jgi:hypothetical protein
MNNSPALATNTEGNYADLSDMWARPAAIDLSMASASTLVFQMVGVSQSNADKLLVEISDDSINWFSCPLQVGGTVIESSISGIVPYWTQVKADLGSLDGKPQAYFRLRFVSDGEGSESGFYIDNLSLTAAASEDTYSFMQGTSMAAGFVSGTAALVLSQDSELTPPQIKSIIQSSADLNQALEERILSGGRVNAFNALTLIQELSLSANAAAGGIRLSWNTDSDARIEAQATIERRTDDQATFTALAQIDTHTGSYIDSDVTSDTTYYYRIHAATTDGDSGYSNQSSATAAKGSDKDSGGSSGGGGCFIGAGGE